MKSPRSILFALAMAVAIGQAHPALAKKGGKGGGGGAAPPAAELAKLKAIRLGDPKAGLFTWGMSPDEVFNKAKAGIEAGDQIVVVQHASGIGKRNGVPVDMRYAVVYTVQDGKIVRGREYATRTQALKAVGLGE